MFFIQGYKRYIKSVSEFISLSKSLRLSRDYPPFRNNLKLTRLAEIKSVNPSIHCIILMASAYLAILVRFGQNHLPEAWYGVNKQSGDTYFLCNGHTEHFRNFNDFSKALVRRKVVVTKLLFGLRQCWRSLLARCMRYKDALPAIALWSDFLFPFTGNQWINGKLI